MDIYLVRHGKTTATEKELYCGRTDLPLSPGGAAEITALKRCGTYPLSADLFFTSGMMRTEQTVDIIYGNVPRKAVPNIAEYDFGSFEMLSHEELKERDDYQSWLTDKSNGVPCPGGESKKQFGERAIAGFRRIINDLDSAGSFSAFVACHGGAIACIMTYLKPNTQGFYEWLPAPGHGYMLTLANGLLQQYKRL